MIASLNKRRFLFQLNHPAHFHLFKNTIDSLQKNGHDVLISIKDKDILKDLVKDFSYVQLSEGYRLNNLFSIIKSIISRDRKLLNIARKYKPDLMVGTSPEIGHISPIIKVPAIFFGEDDVDLSTLMYLGAISCYPFFHTILSPKGVNNSLWNRKTIFYEGFQKLAYLHPNRFIPDRNRVNVPDGQRYYIIRLANLQAYHDSKAKGISNEYARELINILKEKGKIIISSEKPIPNEFKNLEFRGKKEDIHHYLYYADLFIGDSQSMAVESAMLGTPNIRFNDFVGKISVLEEIENKYNLSIGINSDHPNKLIETVKILSTESELVNDFKKRKKKLIDDKIDVTAFYVWFLENYPESKDIMKFNPDYQNQFQ